MRIGEVLRCWKCGATAHAEWVEVTALGDREPQGIPSHVAWPDECLPHLGGHDWDRPPTPDELVEAGHRALDAINRITLDALLGPR